MHIDKSQLDLIRNHQAKTKQRASLISAAVSIVIRDTTSGPEFLLMQRAKHENDPWSGQMAFPGGKFEAQDKSHKHTAIRETQEEVGLYLTDNDFVGQIDDVYGIKANGTFSVHVACFIFKLDREVTLAGNHEVADILWLPMSYLEAPDNAYNFYHPHEPSLKMPAILINEQKQQILWGLSLRMLKILYTILQRPMNAFSAEENKHFKQIEQLELQQKN